MRKRKLLASALAVILILPTGTPAKAETAVPERETSTAGYVVMGEDISELEDLIDIEPAEAEDGSQQAQEAGIVAADLTAAEIRKLERADIVVEENIEFMACSLVSEMEEQVLPVGEIQEREGEETLQPDLKIPESDTEILEEGKAEEEPEKTAEKEPAEAAEYWNLKAVHAENYTNEDASGEKVKIAVLDSGINYRPDIMVQDHMSVWETGEDAAAVFEDATGHGTAIASLICALPNEESVQGMNEDAEVYSVQVLNCQNTGKLSGVVQGIYWAIERDMDIINMSFGTSVDSEVLHKAVRDAKDAGILVVAAAGNTPEEGVQYPAAYPEVIAVGSTNMKGDISEDSARGSQVDIYAPGESILTDAPIFDMDIVSGTSMACAEVTAAASVIWEKDKTKGADFVRGLLEESANGRIDEENKNGLLDVASAMKQYEEYADNGILEEVPVIEEEPLLMFDEGEVQALWKPQDHQKLVSDSGASNGYRLMYAASTYPDDKETKMYRNRRFHGSKNYWQTLEFLVNLAHAYYTHDDKEVQSIYTNASNSVLGTVEKGEKSFQYSTVDVVKDYVIRPKDSPVFGLSGVDENTGHNRAYKLMGVVTHLVGDIYAHRTMVTTKMLSETGKNGFVKSDFNGKKTSVQGNIVMEWEVAWEDFEVQVMKSQVEFRNIKDYLCDGASSTYEDDKNKFVWRYENAQVSVRNLIKDGETYDFRTNTWNKSALKNSGTLWKY